MNLFKLRLELCKRQAAISILPLLQSFQPIAVFMSLAETNLRALRLAPNEAWTAALLVYVTISNSSAAAACE